MTASPPTGEALEAGDDPIRAAISAVAAHHLEKSNDRKTRNSTRNIHAGAYYGAVDALLAYDRTRAALLSASRASVGDFSSVGSAAVGGLVPSPSRGNEVCEPFEGES